MKEFKKYQLCFFLKKIFLLFSILLLLFLVCYLLLKELNSMISVFFVLYNNINLMNQLAVAIISIIVITSASFLVQTILSKSLLYGLIFRMCVFVFQHIYFYVFFLLWQCIETISWKNCMILFLLMNLGNFFVFGFAEIYLARQPRTDIRF